ncbi:MAG: hypothetical protein M3178_10100 [Pseudomonadota bacterium]|nr:hypothetical protein [Pseudomonadota bacterium]
MAGERWADVADQAPTIYAVWGGGATPAQALYMVGLILPPKRRWPHKFATLLDLIENEVDDAMMFVAAEKKAAQTDANPADDRQAA